ncbi:MAG: DUF2203 domain-containing protein [Candidatus Omnitrophica bacterium]|nr:DUF2203 domain-containing protein [Candidatus Omnitrophota bacterium]
MNQPELEPKIFTVDEANACLPKVRELLGGLRSHVAKIIAKEAQIDCAELLAAGPNGKLSAEAQGRLTGEIDELNAWVREFQTTLKAFEQIGCLLKDLDEGLIDFYSMRGGEMIFLCWKDGEDRIATWHRLEEGYPGRQPLD